MALLLLLLTALIPCLLGVGVLCFFDGERAARQISLADGILTGEMVCIGLAEAAYGAAVIMGWSFSRCVNVFWIEIGICCIAAGMSLLWSYHRRGKNHFLKSPGVQKAWKEYFTRRQLPWLLFLLLAGVELFFAAGMQEVCTAGDMTLETVCSFLETDAIYEVNPLTGSAYDGGIPFRLKVLCLPGLYGILSGTFKIEAEVLVYGIIPVVVLLGSYLAYGTLAKYFFPEDSSKRGMFMLIVAILFMAGDYMPGMEGFGVLHAGFSGTAIRGAVLLPYTVGLMLRGRYPSAVLCILAEACIVWTFYGMGYCVLVAAGLLTLRLGSKWCAARKERKEDLECRNS